MDPGTGTFALAIRYIYGAGLDELIAIEAGGQRYFTYRDALGSIEAITDSAGVVVERYDYDAFGVPTVTDGLGVPTPLGIYGEPTSQYGNSLWFTGARWDPESGNYHMRARQYEPLSGKFVSRDPLGYVDGPNAYSYGYSDPANWRDPFGLEAGGNAAVAKRRSPRAQAAHERALHAFRGPEWEQAPIGTTTLAGAVAAGMFVGTGDFLVDTIGGVGEIGVEIGFIAWDAGSGPEVAPLSSLTQHVNDQQSRGVGNGMIAVNMAISTVNAPFQSAGGDIGEGLGQAFNSANAIDIYNGTRQATNGGLQTATIIWGAVASTRLLNGKPKVGATAPPECSTPPIRPLTNLDIPIDLTAHRRPHILNGHRAGSGKTGKTEFPASWSDNKIIDHVSDIATDPNSLTGTGKWDSPYAIGTRDGIQIRVDFYPAAHPKYPGMISTAYPYSPID